jgi:transcriptional regulator with XRE-family HTH domain
MTFGEKIASLRKKKGYSQSELAEHVGIISITIGRYERDEIKPAVDTAAKIAEALDVSLDYLTGSSDALLEKSLVKKITDIQSLPDNDKAHLFALMDAFLRDHKTKKAYVV